MNRYFPLIGIAFVLSIATVMSSLADFHWVFDTAANLRMQGLVVIVFLLGASLMFRRWFVTMASTALLLVNLSMMNLGSLEPMFTSQDSIRVVTTNVLAKNLNHDAIVDELRALDADVMVIIELTPSLARRLRQEFGATHPHRSFEDRSGDGFGIGMLSRLPIDSIEKVQPRGNTLSLQALIGRYRLIATHPLTPIGDRSFQHRNRQLTFLADYIRPSSARPQRTVLLGDFNLTPWNPIFTNLLEHAGLRRAAPRWDVKPTWYGTEGGILRSPLAFLFGLKIDHVLVSDDLVCSSFEIGRDCGSDHRSVLVTLHAREDHGAVHRDIAQHAAQRGLMQPAE